MKIWICGATVLATLLENARKSSPHETNESDAASFASRGKTIAGVVSSSKYTGGSEFDICAYEYQTNALKSSADSLEKMNFQPINKMKFSFDASNNQSGINAIGGVLAASGLTVAGSFCVASLFIPPTSPWVCAAAFGGGVLMGKAASDSVQIDSLDAAWKIALNSTPSPLLSADYSKVKKMLEKSGNTKLQCSDLSGTELLALIEKGRELEARAKKK